MRPPDLPDGYRVLKRGDWWIAHREGLAEALLLAGDGDPQKLAAAGSGRFRGRGRPVAVTLADGTRGVLRRYLHGGVLGRVSGRLFAGRSRPLAELAATARARREGVRVPEVLAAYHRRAGLLFHEGFLLTRLEEGAEDLAEALRRGDRAGEALRDAGREARRMHEAGVAHADLHVKNVLVRGGEAILIDFDGARVLERVPTALRHRNLVRFDRSLEKLRRTGVAVSRQDRLRFFAGYHDDGIEEGEKEALVRRCRRNLVLHRLWWRMTGK